MQFSESWLRAWVNPALDTEELAYRLTMAGLEVEETRPFAPAFCGVVVATIVAIEPHPNADRLRVCQVDDGSGQSKQIVCGAPNVVVGLKVPLAQVGAQLPNGITIASTRMRGIESMGMLCSADELGLLRPSPAHAGLLELPSDLVPGTSLRQALDLDTALFTLKLTPNRADCLSMLGVAREVAALTDTPLVTPCIQAAPVTLRDRVNVTIQAPQLCGRFAGRVIRGVNAQAATPAWLQRRLQEAGLTSISAVVDISNYVMLALGRPNHVFDLDKLAGDLSVRWAQPGEAITLLNGQTLVLDQDVGVVCAGDAIESLAGIMGGKASAVTAQTCNLYVETAFWWPHAIAGRARRYKCASEASHRFERGVDYANIPEHLEYLTQLIIEICGGECGPIDDQVVNLPRREPVQMRLARCRRILGVQISREDVSQIFTRLDFPHRLEGDDTFIVDPPSYRFDLHIEEDLIEEVARIYGFERIPAVLPSTVANMRVKPSTCQSSHTLRHKMAALDYQEVVNFSFVEAQWEHDYIGNPHPIQLLNPLARQWAVMRSSLLSGLLANIQYNANRQQSRGRIFELARVFLRDATIVESELVVAGVAQPLRLAAAAWGASVEEQWGTAARQVDFYDLKMDIEALLGARAATLRFVAAPHPLLHPGRSARIELAGHPVGWLGELHPRWGQKIGLAGADKLMPILFELDVQPLMQSSMRPVQELSRQPAVVRDLAFWVKTEVAVQTLLDTIIAEKKADPHLAIVQEVRLFDCWWEKTAVAVAKEKSLAFRFWLQDTDTTLDDARVTDCLARLTHRLVQTHGARLRS